MFWELREACGHKSILLCTSLNFKYISFYFTLLLSNCDLKMH